MRRRDAPEVVSLRRERRYRDDVNALPSLLVLEYRILGPLEVVSERGPVRLGGPRQRATLAILLLNANRITSVDRIADDLYLEAPPVTAVTQVQRQISDLRKVLGQEAAIETRPPGYVLHVSREQLDLSRFEDLLERATRARADGQTVVAADLLRQALVLWRGAPLADLGYERFVQPSLERLDELRLTAFEQLIDADLELGRHREVVGELEELVREHPIREHLCWQLMLALYRSGRQAEALEVYRRLRDALVEQLGIEPTAELHELERAILTQDRSLDLPTLATSQIHRQEQHKEAVLVIPSKEERLDALLSVAEQLATRAGTELLIASLVAREAELETAVAAVNARRNSLEVDTRAAAFTTADRAADVVRLATRSDAELVLIDAPPGLGGSKIPVESAEILERSPADVAILAGGSLDLARGGGVYVPFAGGEHDWTALELAGWLVSASDLPLKVVGTKADSRSGRRDASRLLADASLAVQRVVGVDTTPLLAEATDEGLVHAVDDATIVVVGISEQWRRRGVGDMRRALLSGARPPTLVVHRGPRPGGLAPRDVRSRFTWTVDS